MGLRVPASAKSTFVAEETDGGENALSLNAMISQSCCFTAHECASGDLLPGRRSYDAPRSRSARNTPPPTAASARPPATNPISGPPDPSSSSGSSDASGGSGVVVPAGALVAEAGAVVVRVAVVAGDPMGDIVAVGVAVAGGAVGPLEVAVGEGVAVGRMGVAVGDGCETTMRPTIAPLASPCSFAWPAVAWTPQ